MIQSTTKSHWRNSARQEQGASASRCVAHDGSRWHSRRSTRRPSQSRATMMFDTAVLFLPPLGPDGRERGATSRLDAHFHNG